VPPLVAQRLLVSAEDHRHGRHGGIDYYAICRAVWRRLVQRRREGASTIEQQIVRVLTNRFERTLTRKVRELLLATLVSEQLPKSATPALYLSIGYYGWRMNGFAQACRRLGLKPPALSLDDAAALVARLKYPEARVPPPTRMAQIRRRAEHLKRLYLRHLSDGTYEHLGGRDAGKTVRTPGRASESLYPIS
jgi:membrane peptidoglycan carboxypeptidase